MSPLKNEISISIKKKNSSNAEVLEKLNKILSILERICDELVIDLENESDESDDEVFMCDSD